MARFDRHPVLANQFRYAPPGGPSGLRAGRLEDAEHRALWVLDLSIALELARDGNRVRTDYEDMASKFFEHFVQITDAMNTLGGTGLWDEADGVYYDQLLAIPSRERLARLVRYLLDENEFLSPYGIRSLSKYHARNPYVLRVGGQEHRLEYLPGEAITPLFGGNSNWRGPVWFPINYLMVEALERYHHFYGDSFRVECPTGSGNQMNLQEVAQEIASRLVRIFLPDAAGLRPCHSGDLRFRDDPHWRDLVLFHEYFHGETGKGLGASHQTGWTALVIRQLEDLARLRR